VTILETLPRALSTEDPEVSELLEREFRKRQVSLLTNARAVSAELTDQGVTIILENERRLSAEVVLLSVGRSFNTEGLGLEPAGIGTGARGEIVVNSRMETKIPGVYAAGDVTGTMLLAHVASCQGIVAACNACGFSREIDYAAVPSGIFTSPEIGSVGLREHQAAEKGIKTRIGRFPFRVLGKAQAMGEIVGMTKVIADAETDRLLGMHIIGPHASDLVHEGALAIRSGRTARDLGEMIHAHPTLSECLMEAAEDVHGRAIHVHRKEATAPAG
jgi:dihydrolipoamide dehydrogenase